LGAMLWGIILASIAYIARSIKRQGHGLDESGTGLAIGGVGVLPYCSAVASNDSRRAVGHRLVVLIRVENPCPSVATTVG